MPGDGVLGRHTQDGELLANAARAQAATVVARPLLEQVNGSLAKRQPLIDRASL